MTAPLPYQGCLKAALAALDTGGGVLSLANPEGRDVIVTKLVLHVTTPATAACTVDGGIAAGATTSADNLIDGQDVNAAAGAFAEVGSNGKRAKLWEDDQYLTVSMASGAAAGLAGYAYVEYIPV
jgi:hypothetical protein